MAPAASSPPRSSTSGYRAEIAAPQAEHLPRSASHDTTGMFSAAVILWPHAGHAERGTMRLYRGSGAAVSPRNSAHCSCQPRSSIRGRRWMTTLRKLPMHRPTTAARTRATAGSKRYCGISPYARLRVVRSDYRAELEDRQVHGDHQTPDDHTEEHDDDRLQQAG